MIEPSPPPSRQLLLFTNLTRWSLRLLLAVWLLLAVAWGTLHWLIVPRIGEWREQVEQLASQALGAPLRIGEISAQSDGLFPVIHLAKVQILDGQGRDGLLLQSVTATVSVRSLLRRGLEQLYIDAPELDIRRLAGGHWQVAGLDPLSSTQTGDGAALDWLLEQPEVVIHQGRVTFTDEHTSADAVAFKNVDFVMRKKGRRHLLRLEATPVAYELEHVQLVGDFRKPLLPSAQASWSQWSGQWYAALNLQHLPRLPWPQAWGVQAVQGHGIARAWVDVAQGQLADVVLDVALPEVNVQWRDPQVNALQLQHMQGRFQGHWQDDAWSIRASDFTFQTINGAKWPTSSWSVNTQASPDAPMSTALTFDYVDLAMAALVARALPVPVDVQQSLEKWAPQGEVRQLKAFWDTAGGYTASGQVKQLTVQPQWEPEGVGIPGVDGMDGTFTLDAHGGSARLDMHSGTLFFPGVFEEPAVAIDALQAEVHWSVKEGRLKVQVPQLTFANADAQGMASGFWQAGEAPLARFPGYLQLQGKLSRANGARVHRYLPLEIPAQARHYVRDSVLHGTSSNVEFEVEGDLQDLPFEQSDAGRFAIKAQVHDVVYAFVPPSLHTGPGHTWPALSGLSGTLIFEGAGMQVQQAQASFADYPQLKMHDIEAQIPNFNLPLLSVNAKGDLDLDSTLALVNKSPLAELTSHAFTEATGQGRIQLNLALMLPIDHLEQSQVSGRIAFQDNGVQFAADVPLVQRLQGDAFFSDQGFKLQNVRGQGLGGGVRISGGMPSVQQGVRVTVEGAATAAGLQADSTLPWLSGLAAYAHGGAAYAVDIQAKNGQQSIELRSDLQGLALDLPEPFNKKSDELAPLQVRRTRSAQGIDTLLVHVAQRGAMRLVRNAAIVPAKWLQGRMVIGAGSKEVVDLGAGFSVQVDLPQLDLDAWQHVAQAALGADQSSVSPEQPWMPNHVQMSVGRLLVQERVFEDVKADMAQRLGLWQGQVEAKHFAGHITYQTPNAEHMQGHLFARFSQLVLPDSVTQKLNELPSPAQLQSLPSLNIEVDELEIAGKALGKLKLKARNTTNLWGREWSLEQFDIQTPEADLRAHGYWGVSAPGQPRSTHLSFVLNIDSMGLLLDRFKMPGVIRDGKGTMHGSIGWQGAPITPEWSSMLGEMHIELGKGQFLKADPGIGKLLSVLSLQSLSRRITLDFRDVFSQGFAFDFIRGDVAIEQGIARTKNLQMKGLNAAVLMEGSANLGQETQDLTAVIVPEINAMTASLAATAINPVIGVGSFLAQMLLRGPLMEAATRTFSITGTWTEPVIEPAQPRVKHTPAEPAPSAAP